MRVLHWAFSVLCPITFLLTSWLYLYPLWKGCSFPTKDHPYAPSLGRRILDTFTGTNDELHSKAEFRLLAFGDPQLEGDTSIWRADEEASYRSRVLLRRLKGCKTFKHQWNVLRNAARDVVTQALPSQLAAWRKQLDLLGNDYYLAHIYRTVHRATQPTHVTVLGDLLGSQWIDDEEFERRAWRYWNRVFNHGVLIGNLTTAALTKEILGADPSWDRRVINVVGNHDIGYAGDISEDRVSRFERAFGRVNWDIVFEHPKKHEPADSNPTLRIIVLNSMNLDSPVLSYNLQRETYDFVNQVITDSKPVEDRTAGTLLLTHIPLHKEAGVCVDSPFFDYHGRGEGGGVKEQNHLSHDVSKGAVLEGIFGLSGNPDVPYGGFGRKGLILNGHDHEGCDTYHYIPQINDDEEDQTRHWNATRFENVQDIRGPPVPGMREVTLRAMMGGYEGFAYMISGWFDYDVGEWRFEVNRCSAGIQHWWWATHVLLLITAGLGGVIAVLGLSTPPKAGRKTSTRTDGPQQTQKDAKRVKTG